MLTIYAYQNCSTCRNALKWINSHHLEHQVIPIRESPPTRAEIKSALAHNGGNIRKLFNTSGADYRALGLKDLLPTMTESDAIDLLTRNGNLVKRPFVVTNDLALSGFTPSIWEEKLL
ncbi:MAG: arsenate reductase family protein [Verrucomicrobiota bacterium JB025]|nr:arsenate reductase family protein [Verrucomicrobiota bacterium JB025]